MRNLLLVMTCCALAGCGSRALYICGGAMRQTGQSISGGSASRANYAPNYAPSSPPYAAGQPAARANQCTSDYACPYGLTCVKAPNAFNGYCAQPVGAYGQPVMYQPQPASVGAGPQSGCSFDTDCSIGFWCAKQPGQIYGACLRR